MAPLAPPPTRALSRNNIFSRKIDQNCAKLHSLCFSYRSSKNIIHFFISHRRLVYMDSASRLTFSRYIFCSDFVFARKISHVGIFQNQFEHIPIMLDLNPIVVGFSNWNIILVPKYFWRRCGYNHTFQDNFFSLCYMLFSHKKIIYIYFLNY